MPLFNDRPPPNGNGQYLPDWFKRLPVLCDNLGGHAVPMPVGSEFSGFERTPSGDPVALYRCRCCGRVEAYGRDRRTGKPRRIFVRPS
jgi:hypothetical protein